MIFYDFLSGGNVRDFKTRHVGRISTRQKEKEDGGEIVKTDNRDEMEQRGRKNLVPEQTNKCTHSQATFFHALHTVRCRVILA